MVERRIRKVDAARLVRGGNPFSYKRLHPCKKQPTLFRKPLCSFVWILVLTTVVALTIINVLMSLKLTYFNGTINEIGFSTENFSTVLYGNKYHHQFPVGYVPSSVSSLYDGFRFVNHTGRLDNTRKYSIHDFVWVGNQWSTLTDQNVCLATQTSVDLLFWLITVAHHWHGPISVSVFVPDHDYYIAIHYIHHVRRCFPVIRDNVSFHFVYPIKRPPKFLSKLTNGTSLSCSEIHRFNSIMNWQPDTAQSWKKTLLYPQNHMRNVARKGCQTPYVFLTDIDIIPRMGLCSLLHQFLQHPPCERCVFVIPTYEVDNDIALPPNKTMLVELVRRKKAQPFHNAVFINNQFATNASKWENLPEEVGLNFVYPVTNFELYYEPFYVSKDDVPPHDERFVGYGYTRNTQVYEMYVASYQFLVLNHAFAMHRGLKLKKSKNSWREKQNRANSKQFKKFEKEILARYGFSPQKP